MRKLKLDLEALSIQSFELEPRMQRRGTVVGRETEYYDTCANTEAENCADFSLSPAGIDTCDLLCETNYVCSRQTACRPAWC